MPIADEEDLPYGENYHDEAEAAAWADAAARKRPWRPMLFDHFVAAARASTVAAPRVLELGSGPGFLAEQVLDRCASVARYTLLDFSEAMLALSRRRLDRHQTRTKFVCADFKSESWAADCDGPFDLVFSLQAVHELRHKRHAPRLYRQIRPLLSPAAQLVVCDHLPGAALTAQHRRLYMTVPEYLAVLANAGFPHA
jgi:SAM-dependent methyltransferase